MREERQRLVEKCRDLEWGKDQETKALSKTIAKLKTDFDQAKLS